MIDTKPAVQAANGKTPEQMLTMMQKTCNAVIPYATIHQMFMIQQKLQLKMPAQMAWTMIATKRQTAMTAIAMAQ